MATKPVSAAQPFTINANDDYELGGVGSRAGIIAISIEDSSCDGTLTLKARVTGSGHQYRAIPYTDLFLNGATGLNDPSTTTAITDSSILQLDASGLDLMLSCSGRTAGSYSVCVRKAPA